jgi:MHS family proline/betaine transporter-like MFS transporter
MIKGSIQMAKKPYFFIVSLGTLIEYYDYALMSVFLPIMAPFFFHTTSHYHALVDSYWVLCIALLARPLGGFFFGYFGDVLGRRVALMFSMVGIAVATLGVGFLPGYVLLGFWAPVLLTLLKSIQLFCFGGEYNGAGLYVVEHAANKKEGIEGSMLTALTLGGGLLATSIGVALTHHSMPANAWRWAYFFGAFIGFVAIVLRHSLKESPEFKPADTKKHSLSALFENYPKQLTAAFFVGGFATLSFTTVLTFLNPVLMTIGYFTAHQMMWLQTGLILFAMIVLIATGKLADRHSPLKVMRYGAWGLVILACPLMWLINTKILWLIIICELALILCNEILLGPANAYLKKLFPPEYRYRGISIAFCSGMSLVGGLTPIIENQLYASFHSFAAAGIWIVLISLLTALSIQKVKGAHA